STKAFRTHFPESIQAQSSAVDIAPIPKEPVICQTFNQSPDTHPFVQRLPIPPQLRNTILDPAPQEGPNIAHGEAPPACHQRWLAFPFVNQFAVKARPALSRFHPDLGLSYVWAFNGVVPGPTIIGRYGQPAVVRFYNGLNQDHTGPGIPQITVHLHNGHTASE